MRQTTLSFAALLLAVILFGADATLRGMTLEQLKEMENNSLEKMRGKSLTELGIPKLRKLDGESTENTLHFLSVSTGSAAHSQFNL
jgi:hypothetical protein